jgi:MFS family permease
VQNFDQLLIARAVLGLGFGGEWAAGAVLMGEAIRPQYRGRAVGSVQSGWAVGWGLAVLSQAILFSLCRRRRVALDVRDRRAAGACWCSTSAAPSPSRRSRRGPRKQAASGDRPALWEIFSGPILKTTILASLMATGCQGGYLRRHLLGAAVPDQGAALSIVVRPAISRR